MEKLKFTLLAIVTLSLLGFLGYWAFLTLQSGSEHATTQKVKELEKENEELKAEIRKQADELSALQSQLAKPVLLDETSTVQTPTTKITYKYQSLIDELQKLVRDNIFLKLKSAGTRVGTVQKFLNIYNDTSNKVDNDYGVSTKTAVIAFQKAMGLVADGEAGPTTFTKMIDWLKKQG